MKGHFFSSLPQISLSCSLFVLGCLTYAAFGSPTPDHLGLVEVIVFLCLLFSAQFGDIARGQIYIPLVAYGMLVPLLAGVMNGVILADLFRDIIPFLFLFLVLIYRRHAEELGDKFYHLIAMMGFLFSIRAMTPFLDLYFSGGSFEWGTPFDLLYLSNNPEVLFSALWMIGCAARLIWSNGRWGMSCLLIVLSLSPILSMVLMMQRAGLVAVAVVCGVMIYEMARRTPRRTVIVLAFLLFLGASLWGELSFVSDAMIRKTHLVGLNSRVQEWQQVFSLVFDGWGHALFGYGWGSRLENPAVGGLSVLYTHSLFSSLLFKTGLLGMVVIMGGLLTGIIRSLPDLFRDRVLFWALIFPFVISAGFYASYKSLGFGLILLVFLKTFHQKLETKSPLVA